MELITLKARKVRTTEHGYTGYKTEFYQDGKLFATIPLGSRQPKTGQKTIWLNGWKWALEWEPVVLVRFYIEPVGGQVMAYFPKEIHSFNGYRPDNRVCYSHIGQHSACHPDYLKKCRKATTEQQSALLQELVSIGYNNLEVR